METKRNPKLLKLTLIAIAVCVALLVILFFGTPRFPKDTRLCGQDLSGKTFSSSEALISRLVSDYQLKLTLEGKEYVLSAGDLGLAFQQNSFRQQAKAAAKAGTELRDWDVLQWNAEKLAAFLNENFDERRTDAVPAQINWNGDKSVFEHTPGQPETFYSLELVTRMIEEAVGQLQPELVITSEDIFTENTASTMDTEVQELTRQANEKLTLALEFVFDPRGGSRTVVSADPERLAALFRFDLETGAITVDEAAALAYAGELAEGKDVVGGKAGFLTHGNREIDIQVEVPDSHVDTAALAADLVYCITENVSGSRDVAYVSDSNSPNFEGTYLEVNIAEQHLWLYENGVPVVEADIVTGKSILDRDTITGRFMIHNHFKNTLLSPGYFVEYWMAFVSDGEFGFHDANHWREPEEYGGTTYIKNGSGGCVNVPVEIMKELHSRVPNGTPVVIYNQSHVSPIYGPLAQFWNIGWGKFDMNMKVRAEGAKLTYSSSDESIATVSQDGIVTPISGGEVVISVHMEATEEYEAYTHELHMILY